jgi:hypothetical protein
MKTLLQYVLLPLAITTLLVVALLALGLNYPKSLTSAALFGILTLYILRRRKETNDRARGWRVGHQGRDQMFYEEFSDEEWKRIKIDGEMLTGKAHHVVYLSSIKYPDWAQQRMGEINSRIMSEFKEPGYEY